MEPVIETVSRAHPCHLRHQRQAGYHHSRTDPTRTAPSAPTGTPLLHDGHVDIKLDANGSGTVTTAPVKIEKSGWYSYDTDWAGDDDNAAYDAGYGVPAETGRITTWTPRRPRARLTSSSPDPTR